MEPFKGQAAVLSVTDEGIAEAGKRLRDGGLVAFPTETVKKNCMH